MWPKKFEIEGMLIEVAYSFPKVFHAMLMVNDSNKEYTARICMKGEEPFRVTNKIWEYDKIILEVERKLLELHK